MPDARDPGSIAGSITSLPDGHVSGGPHQEFIPKWHLAVKGISKYLISAESSPTHL